MRWVTMQTYFCCAVHAGIILPQRDERTSLRMECEERQDGRLTLPTNLHVRYDVCFTTEVTQLIRMQGTLEGESVPKLHRLKYCCYKWMLTNEK